MYGQAELSASFHLNNKNMDAKTSAEYLLREMNLQTISQEYASAIRDLCEKVISEPNPEAAYCFGFLMGAQHANPKTVIRVMSENLKPDWQKFNESFFNR